ncbi:MAG: hypothetical protein MJE77_34330 [Proteobacteria bacterium]|nr:hypothetical protein [Pseudomonadota bacterium]
MRRDVCKKQRPEQDTAAVVPNTQGRRIHGDDLPDIDVWRIESYMESWRPLEPGDVVLSDCGDVGPRVARSGRWCRHRDNAGGADRQFVAGQQVAYFREKTG